MIVGALTANYDPWIARDMKAGHWRLTHQGIAFDPAGVLIDGQHRLWAIVESDTTLLAWSAAALFIAAPVYPLIARVATATRS